MEQAVLVHADETSWAEAAAELERATLDDRQALQLLAPVWAPVRTC